MKTKFLICLISIILISGLRSFSQIDKFVQTSNFYFDEGFNPHLKITYRNTLKKNVSQIMYAFVYNDYSDWAEGNMKRTLLERSTVRVIRNVNLPVGKVGSDDFAIPTLDGYESKKPKGRIIKIRYSDGSVDSY